MNLLEFYDSIGRVNRVLYPSPAFLSSVPTRSLALVLPRISLELIFGISFTLGEEVRNLRWNFGIWCVPMDRNPGWDWIFGKKVIGCDYRSIVYIYIYMLSNANSCNLCKITVTGPRQI